MNAVVSRPSAGQVIEAYLKLRTQKEELSNRHKDEMAPLNLRMEKLEAFMLLLLNNANVDSMAFKGTGTMFKQNVCSITVAEWNSTLAWIKEHNAWEFLERRVSKTVVQEYAEHHGEVPPGIDIKNDTVVRVRKT